MERIEASFGGMRVRPSWLLLAALTTFVAGCAQVGTNNLTFWDVIWAMIAFFFWFIFIWIFIALFADIFRRGDLTGWAKAGWILLLVILPFLGALIYIAMRPRAPEFDERVPAEPVVEPARSTYSPAEEIARLQELRQSGAISDPEYEELKRRALAGSA